MVEPHTGLSYVLARMHSQTISDSALAPWAFIGKSNPIIGAFL